MTRNNIMYTNLRAEMARKNMCIADVANAVHMNRDTLSRKFSGKSPLFLNEALDIQRKCFDDTPVLELFDTES